MFRLREIKADQIIKMKIKRKKEKRKKHGHLGLLEMNLADMII